MVRIKHRYLLVEILSPSLLPTSSTTHTSKPTTSTTSTSTTTPAHLLSLHAPTPDTTTASSLLHLLRTALQTLHGDHGAALAGPALQIKYWSNATSTFIVRCKREVVALVWGAVTCVTVLGGRRGDGGSGGGRERERERGKVEGEREREREVVMRVVRVSGTVRKCEEEAVRRAKVLCGRVRGVEVAVEGGLGRWGVGGGVVGGDEEGSVREEDVFGGQGGGESEGASDDEGEMDLG